MSRARRARFCALLWTGANIACGGSSDAETAARRQLANQLLESHVGSGGSAGEPTGQAGSLASPSAGAGGTATPLPPPAPVMPPAADAASGPPQECSGPDLANGVFGTPAPLSGLLVDFSTYTARVGNTGGAWGDAALGEITGGTSLYSINPAAALSVTVEAGELRLRATLAASMDYTGIVLWFAPCVNATAFSGIEVPLSGVLGGTRLLIKPQTSPNYPVDVNNTKGKCEYLREDEKFSTCVQPTTSVAELTDTPLVLRWNEFVDGQPQSTPDPAQLLGLELQFQCQAADGGCALDLRIGTIQFTTP